MRNISFRPFLALLLSWVPSVSIAQTTGELAGRVQDSSGLPIPGALVEVRSPALIRLRQTASDKEGRYRFQLLPPGVYEIMARQTGFNDTVEKDVRIPLGETITVPMTLTVTATASVEVDTTPPLLDVEHAKAGITVNQKALQNLPLGRNYASAAALVPGTGRDVLGPTFYGASSLENSYQIDGVNTTAIQRGGQGKTIPLDFIQDLEIRSGGYEAEYGKALGGNINVLTKGGATAFYGNVFGYYASDSLGAADKHAADRPAVNAPELEVPIQSDAGFTLGGPILRDHIWFFGAFSRADTVQDYTAVDHVTFSETGEPSKFYEDRTDRTRANLFALNLSWMPSSSQSLSLSVFGDPSSENSRTADNKCCGTGPASATVTEKRTGGTNVSGRLIWFWSSFLAELQYGYHEQAYRESNDASGSPVMVEIRSGVWQALPGSGPLPQSDMPFRLVDATYRRNSVQASGTWSLGAHQLKAAFSYELENPDRTARISGGEAIVNFYLRDGTYDGTEHNYLAALPLNCIKLTGGQRGNFGYVDPDNCLAWQKTESVRSDLRSRSVTAFIQDTWRPVSNLTVNAGLRYEEQRLTQYDGSVALTLKDQWSPRVSVSWSPGSSGRSKVFGSYGRYYQALPEWVQTNFLAGEILAVVVNESLGVDPIGTWGAGLYEPSYVPEQLDGMYQDEFTLGIEIQPRGGWVVGLRGVYRGLGRAIDDRCDGRDSGQGIAGYFPENGTADCTLMNPGYGDMGQLRDPENPNCFEDFPANTKPAPCESVRASRIYRGLELTVRHQPTKDFYLLASYVYSRLSGNYDGLVFHRYVGDQQTDPGTSQAFDYGLMLPRNYGRLPSDRTHQVKMSGYYTFPFGLTAGAVGQFWSGQPLSTYGFAKVPHQPWYGWAFLEPRGSSSEMPSTYNIDLHLHYDWRIGNVTVTPALDVFNLTNVQRALDRYQTYNTPATNSNKEPPFTNPTNARFGKDTTWQTPRLIRLGLKVAF
ncbi:MAG: TonB-dependent receptor [Acidobacteria bacterium]|nr:TonB-dependent receptor [Acidobacteriota bacterium]